MYGLAAALGMALLLAGQSQESQPPRTTFKSNVDLVPVDVNVVDRNGRPVAALAAEDFSLSVDGKPRRIASAQFVSVEHAALAAPPRPLEYTSNAGAQAGRLVMIVIDVGNIGAGRGKAAIQAARRFVAGLSPADRVALVTLPGAGPQIEFTSNHAIVRALLGNVVGQAVENPGQARVGLAEALAIQREDQIVIDQVTSRECPPASSSSESLTSCLFQLKADGQTMLAQLRQRAGTALTSLRYLFERMAASDTPKTVVLISEGLLLDREYTDLSWVEPRAAAAHVSLFVLQLDQADIEAGAHRPSPSRSEDREVLRDGLGRLAGMASGEVFRIAANADFAFERVALELSGYYLLSFEPQPGDRDGKPHKIKIDVRRKDLTLRARREFSAGALAARSSGDSVLETLRAPLLATDIGVKVTTYTFQDPDSARLKIILAADIDRALNADGQVALGYLLIDDKGKLVSSDLEPSIGTPIDRATRTQKYLGAAFVAPGAYTLKVAVVDDAGRRGSVERTFAARINALGQLRATDLLIGDNSVRGTQGLPPAVAADFSGDEMHAYLELFSDVPEQLTNATVVMEIAKDEASSALDGTPARFQQAQTTGDRRRAAEAGIPIGLLPPGEYIARAVVSVSGRKVGQVVRPFRVTRAAPAITSPGAGTVPVKAAAPIPFTPRIDAFDTSVVLSPQVVGFFLDRMRTGAAANAAAVRPAMDSLRAGRFEEATRLLANAGDDELAAVFLKGIVLLSKGDLNGAAGRFRDALRLDSEFAPAAFYLGACYAAGGRDRDAAGAWHASLITEPGARFVYILLGDALLRLRDMDQAIDVLVEARRLWPADDDVAIRLGAALVMADHPGDALKILGPYLEAHPTDHERLFLALRALYVARTAGRTLATPESDRALFLRYASAYATARGPQLTLVDQWRKYVEK